MHRLIITLSAWLLLTSCGGGGGGSSDSSSNLPERLIIAASPAGDISVRDFNDCNGDSWSECVKITATVRRIGSPRLDSFGWILDTARGSGSGNCGAATQSADGYTLIVPAYCSDSGYECRFSANVDGRDSNTGFAVFDQYITWVSFGALQCAQGSGVVFNGERLSNATVFVDANGNLTLDDGEIKTDSNFFGEFVLTGQPTPFTLVAKGGTGIDSGIEYADSVLVATVSNEERPWISPISTVHAFSSSPTNFDDWLSSQELVAPNSDQPSYGYSALSEQIRERANQISTNSSDLPIAELNGQIADEILTGKLENL